MTQTDYALHALELTRKVGTTVVSNPAACFVLGIRGMYIPLRDRIVVDCQWPAIQLDPESYTVVLHELGHAQDTAYNRYAQRVHRARQRGVYWPGTPFDIIIKSEVNAWEFCIAHHKQWTREAHNLIGDCFRAEMDRNGTNRITAKTARRIERLYNLSLSTLGVSPT